MADMGYWSHGMVSSHMLSHLIASADFTSSPGRFFATAGIKQIFGLVITKYDVDILDRCAPRKYSWRTCNVPRSDLPIVLQPRASAT